MQRESSLVLWLAGNQFVAMDDVIRAFQRKNRDLSVGLITLPPGLLRTGIESGGWRYAGREFPGLPDVFASVNLEDLRKLKARGLMTDYAIYMHNELVLMVASGNPKGIRGIEDLRRADVRTSMPNPVNEGIMQCCARKVLEKHGLWPHISGGKACFSCQATPLSWFTSVHHRETPDRILAGQSDTGIVWLTEAIAARQEGKAVEAVRLPPEDSLRDEVNYVIGALATTSRRSAADRYLSFVATDEVQEIYARHGFVKATQDELHARPIP
jgi:ABC-type molybdate transport system substrate-binding protein